MEAAPISDRSLPTSGLGSIHHALQFLSCFYKCLAEFLSIIVLGSDAPSNVVVVDSVRETVAVFHHWLSVRFPRV